MARASREGERSAAGGRTRVGEPKDHRDAVGGPRAERGPAGRRRGGRRDHHPPAGHPPLPGSPDARTLLRSESRRAPHRPGGGAPPKSGGAPTHGDLPQPRPRPPFKSQSPPLLLPARETRFGTRRGFLTIPRA